MTEIVVSKRNGIITAPDGSKYRVVRGRTFADARHPVAKAYPDSFMPYKIDLPYEGDDEHDGPSAAERGDGETWPGKVAEAESVAEGYRLQLATIVDGLQTRGLMPVDVDTEREGWLVEVLFGILDAGVDPVAPPAAPRRAPGRPRKSTE
jgi:hypothetical protein